MLVFTLWFDFQHPRLIMHPCTNWQIVGPGEESLHVFILRDMMSLLFSIWVIISYQQSSGYPTWCKYRRIFVRVRRHDRIAFLLSSVCFLGFCDNISQMYQCTCTWSVIVNTLILFMFCYNLYGNYFLWRCNNLCDYTCDIIAEFFVKWSCYHAMINWMILDHFFITKSCSSLISGSLFAFSCAYCEINNWSLVWRKILKIEFINVSGSVNCIAIWGAILVLWSWKALLLTGVTEVYLPFWRRICPSFS